MSSTAAALLGSVVVDCWPAVHSSLPDSQLLQQQNSQTTPTHPYIHQATCFFKDSSETGNKKIHNTPAADPPPVCNPNSGSSPVKETADRRMQRNTSWDVVHRRWSIAAATVILQSAERVFSSLTTVFLQLLKLNFFFFFFSGLEREYRKVL